MLEGTQRGRNELIQGSIYRDTGVRRDRKQISSHLQVLKSKLRAVPAGECSFRTLYRLASVYSHWLLMFGRQSCVCRSSVRRSENSYLPKSFQKAVAVALLLLLLASLKGLRQGYQNETNQYHSPSLYGHTRGLNEAPMREHTHLYLQFVTYA
jgi:hypothetical protein